LWDSLPQVYRECDVCYTDFWSSYNTIIPEKCHKAVGKETGETNHIERFNNTSVNGFLVWSEAISHFQKNLKTISELYGTLFIITILILPKTCYHYMLGTTQY
jgi:IS1 family transposase